MKLPVHGVSKPQVRRPAIPTKALRRKLFLSALVLGIVAGVMLTGLSLRQAQLDRDLLAAIGRDDTETAIALLNAGADANAFETVEMQWFVTPHAQESPLDRLRIFLFGQQRSSTRPLSALYLVYALPFRTVAGPARSGRGHLPSTSAHSVRISAHNESRHSEFGHTEPQPENYRLVKALLDHGADPNLYPHRNGPLITAIRLGHTQTVRLLLEHHADPNREDEPGILPIMSADLDSARLLIQHGAKVNVHGLHGLTPLMMAAANRRGPAMDCVELFLDSGADPNARDDYGQTPLMHATTVQVAKRILDHHGDINARSATGMTALMMDCMNDADPNVSHYLLDRGADSSFKDNHGKPALDYAAERLRVFRLMMPMPGDEDQLRQCALLKSLCDRLKSPAKQQPALVHTR